VITGIEVPLEAAIAASLAALALGTFVERRRARRARHERGNPLAALFIRETLGSAARDASRRLDHRAAAQAVLHGRLDQSAMLRTGWDAATREQVLGHVAAVIKAGIRRDDSFAQIEGGGFTIIMPGADERAARGVADRLRRALAQTRLPQSGMANPFTASFGVAAGRSGDAGDALVARALAALEAARKAGPDHVVAASEIEDVIYLPAPDRSPEAATA
jgi:diguanylate cyclase (GGDEF)-like protein